MGSITSQTRRCSTSGCRSTGVFLSLYGLGCVLFLLTVFSLNTIRGGSNEQPARRDLAEDDASEI